MLRAGRLHLFGTTAAMLSQAYLRHRLHSSMDKKGRSSLWRIRHVLDRCAIGSYSPMPCSRLAHTRTASPLRQPMRRPIELVPQRGSTSIVTNDPLYRSFLPLAPLES